MIPISKPFFNNLEKKYLSQVLNSKILVDGPFQHKVEEIIKKKNRIKFYFSNTKLHTCFRNIGNSIKY